MEQLRKCIVNDQICYFHGWNKNSDVIAPSPFVGGHAGGVVSHTYGIVEFPDGTVSEFIYPREIKFCDNISRDLYFKNDHYQAHKEKEEGEEKDE